MEALHLIRLRPLEKGEEQIHVHRIHGIIATGLTELVAVVIHEVLDDELLERRLCKQIFSQLDSMNLLLIFLYIHSYISFSTRRLPVTYS